MKVEMRGLDKILATLDRTQKRNDAVIKACVKREGEFLRGEIVKGLDSGAPGGKSFAPLSPLTLALRKGGTKILIRSGGLRNGITVKMQGSTAVVMVSRKVGKHDIAHIHEHGREWSKPMSAKQRKWLFAMLNKHGLKKKGAKSPAVRKVRIPPRPFVRPILEKFATPPLLKARFMKNMKELHKGDVGS